MQDRLLLKQFVRHESQAAFAEIVRRYLKLVYSTCLHEVGDRQVAEDVTQGVFLILAQKAPSLGKHSTLAGWLFRTARLASKGALRQEHRRRRREHQATQFVDTAGPPQEDLRLNEALAALGPSEREAVLLRFFEEASFQEVGEALGTSEDTAQKRVSRALEKMRVYLARNSEALSTTVLVGVLSAEAARSVPSDCAGTLMQIAPGLKISIEASGLFGSRAYQISQGVLRTMKAKAALTTASVSILAVASVSLLMAGVSKTGGNIVGTWTYSTYEASQETGSATMQFRPDGQVSLESWTNLPWWSENTKTHKWIKRARRRDTQTAAGTYTLSGDSLAIKFTTGH